MRWVSAGLILLLGGVCFAADSAPAVPAASAPALCSDVRGSSGCPGPVDDLKAARKAFHRGIKEQKSHNLDQAFYEFEDAARLVPQNVEYVTAREITRQRLVGMHLERGNGDLDGGRQVEAMAEFRSALTLDPQNEFAQQRVFDALGSMPLRVPASPQIIASADSIAAKPVDERHDFHYRGDSRGLISAIASSYGLTVIFDDSFPNRRVRFDLDTADFATAMQTASVVTKSFIVALSDTELFACADSVENRGLYGRMGMRSFFIPGGLSATDMQQIVNTLRSLLDFKFVSMNAAASTITVRGPLPALETAGQLLDQLDSQQPEAMLDLKVFQIDHTYMRNIGLHVPDNFNLFNIPVAALAALGGQNIQTLINQLIASGGINQAGNQTIAALIAQLQSQQNSVFSQPVATFGGGLTFFGLSLDQLSAVLSMNESDVRSIQHVTLRASQSKDATFKLGQRYPILNASFAPVFNNAAISQVVGNSSYVAPFPSVNYEDIGLTLKAKPLIHSNSDVSLELEIELRTLGATGSNGIPIILNREYKGGIMLKEGEPAVIAGMISTSDSRSLSGLPLFSALPGFGLLTSQHTRQDEEDEVLILITPHIVRDAQHYEPPEIWVSK
jgi:general secretion pathway protein D